jgi:aldose sugar dehydrogenase
MTRIPAAALGLAVALALAGCQAPNGNTSRSEAAPATAADAADDTSNAAGMRVETVAEGFEHPWSVALLPDGGFLVTERPGRLRRVGADGSVSDPLTGVPEVWARGQGGLLDVVLAPDFETSNRIYLSYSEAGDRGTAGTAIAHATFGAQGLSDLQVVFRQQPKLVGPNHFGSRLVFDRDGHLLATLGERNDRPTAQRLDMLQGKVVRINPDGSIPRDNPFVGRDDAHPAIWSYGHRNAQSAALDPRTGRYWTAEHGPRGGDEINIPEPGRNYGWPVITHGINYSGLPIPEARGREREGMEPPYHVWEKSPGLSGMAFYTGRPDSTWNDSLFLGALAESNLIRLSLDGDRITGEERLLDDLGQRIRDVRVGDDGSVYVLTDHAQGALLRLVAPRR